MEFRIGLNVGDVITDEDRLYGDGVNIAARLEGLADPGGICLSGTVYDHIATKLDVPCTYHGEQTVKNIAQPVRAYMVELDADGTAPHGRQASPAHRPSAAPRGARRWSTAAVAVAATFGPPLAQEPAIPVEHLNPAVVTDGYVDPPDSVHRNATRS